MGQGSDPDSVERASGSLRNFDGPGDTNTVFAPVTGL
jgi:hypothetical protein